MVPPVRLIAPVPNEPETIVLPLVMLAFAIYFWTRRKELTDSSLAQIGASEALPV